MVSWYFSLRKTYYIINYRRALTGIDTKHHWFSSADLTELGTEGFMLFKVWTSFKMYYVWDGVDLLVVQLDIF